MGASLGLFSGPNELVLEGCWAVAAGLPPAAGEPAAARDPAPAGAVDAFCPAAATAGEPAGVVVVAAGDAPPSGALAPGDADAAGAAFSSSKGVRCPTFARSGPVRILPNSTGRSNK